MSGVERAVESVWTVVVGGGTGTRFGGPKQYELLGDRRVLDHSVDTARAIGDGVVVVLPAGDVRRHATSADAVAAGGASRTESVRNGLAHVPTSATIICVHDAARPFASAEIYRSVITAVAAGADGAVPGVPVTDTIKVVGDVVGDVVGQVVGGEVVDQRVGGAGGANARPVVETPPRDRLVAVQTPQAFRAEVLRAAHASGLDATDDAALVERAGGRVVVVPGEVRNRKITLPDDLEWARSLLAAQR